MNHWKTAFFILLILILVSGVALAAYFMGRNNFFSFESDETLPTFEPTGFVASTPTLTPVPAPVPVNEDVSIIEAVLKAVNLTEDKAEVMVTSQQGNFAKGNVKEKGTISGGYFLAVKTASGWVVVYDGQANPECADVNQYNFPTSMVPECLNENGTVVQR